VAGCDLFECFVDGDRGTFVDDGSYLQPVIGRHRRSDCGVDDT
jgi:hypothetical protein